LIDTFKPKTVLVEDGPLQSTIISTHPDSEISQPKIFELVTKIQGKDFESFINLSIVGNSQVYKVNESKSLINKLYSDGIDEPIDMPSYAYYHLKTH
jgi:hypothetical protein